MKTFRGENIASLLGYTYEYPRALYLLLTERQNVQLEKADDVFTYDNDGKYLKLEQVKSITKKEIKSNSECFLNTMRNWYDVIKKNPSLFTPDTKFILFLEQKNKICTLLQQAVSVRDAEDAKRVLEQIKSSIKWTTKNTTAQTILKKQEYLKMFESDMQTSVKIIQNFSIEQPQISILDDLLTYVSDEYKCKSPVSLVDSLLGWIIDKAINPETKKKQELKLPYNDFLINCLNSRLRPFSPIIIPQTETAKDIQNEKNKRYVAQHKIINSGTDVIKSAIQACLGWKKLIISDSFIGMTTEKDIKKAYRDLKNRWIENKENIFSSSSKDDIEKGKNLYNTSINEEVCIDNIPVSFSNMKEASRGSHNFLADKPDNDELAIGWHPDFKNKLKEETQND